MTPEKRSAFTESGWSPTKPPKQRTFLKVFLAPGVTLSQPDECRIDRFPVHSAALDLVASGRGREVIGDLLTNHAAELPGYIGAFELHLETPAYIEATQARPRR